MKSINEKDKRICRNLFFEAASVCEYSTGGCLLGHDKSAKTRRKYFVAAKYKRLKAEFQGNEN